MVRILTTTNKGVEFLSPFIYSWEKGGDLVRRLKKWHQDKETGLPGFELVVEQERHPGYCYMDEDWELDDMMDALPLAEGYWGRYEG